MGWVVTWGLSSYLCLTVLAPLVVSIFFPNSAYKPISHFLHNKSYEEETTHEEDKDYLWYLFINLDPIARGSFVFVTPLLADFFGRRKTLLISLVLSVPGNVVLSLASTLGHWEALFLGRFLCSAGRCFGGDILIVIFAEIAPLHVGGRLKALAAICISISVSVAAILGMESVFGTPELWPMVYGVCAVMNVASLPAILIMKETPAFLARKAEENRKALTESLEFYFGSTAREAAVTLDATTKKTRNGCTAMAKLFTLRRHLLILVAINFCTAYSNIVRQYSTSLFVSVSLSHEQAGYATSTLKIGSTIALCGTFFLVDRIGRRTHYFVCLIVAIIGLIGMAVWELVRELEVWSGSAWAYVGFLFIHFVATDLGPRCLNPLIQSEIYPHPLRMSSRAASLILLCLINIGFGFAFLPLRSYIGWPVYAILAFATGKRQPRCPCVSSRAASLILLCLINIGFGFAFCPLRSYIGWPVYAILAFASAVLGVLLYMYMPETSKKETSEIMAQLSAPPKIPNIIPLMKMHGLKRRPVEPKPGRDEPCTSTKISIHFPPESDEATTSSQEPPAPSQEPPAPTQDPPVVSQEPPVISQDPPAISQGPPAISQEPPSFPNDIAVDKEPSEEPKV